MTYNALVEIPILKNKELYLTTTVLIFSFS